MTRQRGQREPLGKTQVEVENVGGIDRTSVEFGPGTTVLSGRNATNRTSFLRSIMAGMGSDRPTLKADAKEGRVELSLGGDTYTRTFERTQHGVITGGDPYLDDATDADLFAFLLGNNEARRAVERGEDLREVMLRPIDTEEVESEIKRLQAERDEVEHRLEELEGLQQSRLEFEDERARVEREIETIEEEIAEQDDPGVPIEDGREQQAELEDLLEELSDARGSLEDTKFDLSTERESIGELEDELDMIEDELAEVDDISEERVDALTERIETLRSERTALESEISQLGTVSEFNNEMIDRHAGLFADDQDDGDVTDALLEEGDTVTCWTCGTDVEVEAIETALAHLKERRQEMGERRARISSELEEARNERVEIQRRRGDHERLQEERDAIRTEIEDRKDRITELEAERDEREEEVDTLEARVEALERDDYNELLERQREANQREFELRRLENERERLTENIEQIDEQLERRDSLNERLETIGEELVDLRTRVDRIEQESVEAFNDHMAELLDVLDYENIDRVWIERRQVTVRDGRGTVDRTVFEHHVVRTAEDGSTYEDTVDHLSESEREVIGLVFALAGYLVHELHEDVPFVLLDSLEVIDANRIASVVEYFETYAESLVVALLPEDAAAIDDEAEYITGLS